MSNRPETALPAVARRIARTSPVVRDADYNALIDAINESGGSALPALQDPAVAEGNMDKFIGRLLERLSARVAELEALVEAAYREGLDDGMDHVEDGRSIDAAWEASDARKALEAK